MKYSILRILLILATGCNLSQSVYCPPYCQCFVSNHLRTVNCIGENLFSIELNIPRTVESLNVSYNIISELRDNIFQNLGIENIIKLNLSHNGINSIGLHAFKGLDNIEFVDLSYNHLYGIDPSTFQYNPSMEHLILSNNPSVNIPLRKPFLISDSIKTLQISNCRISSLPLLAFTRLPHLEMLNISNNDILLLHESIATGLENLIQLDITNTGIRCEGKNSYLKEWSVMKAVNILGTTCGTMIGSKMFEKMVMEDNPDILDDDDYVNIDGDNASNSDRQCICSEFEEDELLTTTKKPVSLVDTKEKRISLSDYRSMVWLSFLNGFVAGGALFSSLILFWSTCYKYRCKLRRRRPQINQTQQYGFVNYETPPPSYNDLF